MNLESRFSRTLYLQGLTIFASKVKICSFRIFAFPGASKFAPLPYAQSCTLHGTEYISRSLKMICVPVCTYICTSHAFKKGDTVAGSIIISLRSGLGLGLSKKVLYSTFGLIRFNVYFIVLNCPKQFSIK